MGNISDIGTGLVLALCLDDDPLDHLVAGQATLRHALVEGPWLPPSVRLSCRLGLPLWQMLHRVCQACKWQAGAHYLRAVQLRVVNAQLLILVLQKFLTLLEIIVKESRLLSICLTTHTLCCCTWRYLRVLSSQIEWMRLVEFVFCYFLETWFWIDQGSDFIV